MSYHGKMFPALVGMNHGGHNGLRDIHDVPRTRGDEPPH